MKSEESETRFLHSRLTGKHVHTFTLGFVAGVLMWCMLMDWVSFCSCSIPRTSSSGVSPVLLILVFFYSNINIWTQEGLVKGWISWLIGSDIWSMQKYIGDKISMFPKTRSGNSAKESFQFLRKILKINT